VFDGMGGFKRLLKYSSHAKDAKDVSFDAQPPFKSLMDLAGLDIL